MLVMFAAIGAAVGVMTSNKTAAQLYVPELHHYFVGYMATVGVFVALIMAMVHFGDICCMGKRPLNLAVTSGAATAAVVLCQVAIIVVKMNDLMKMRIALNGRGCVYKAQRVLISRL